MLIHSLLFSLAVISVSVVNCAPVDDGKSSFFNITANEHSAALQPYVEGMFTNDLVAQRASMKTLPIYKKFAQIHARKAVVGEIVVTKIYGKTETKSKPAEEGDWVATGLSKGEQWLVKGEDFWDLYETQVQEDFIRDDGSLYQAKGVVHAIEYNISESGFETVFIQAPWDELMNSLEGEKSVWLVIGTTAESSDGVYFIEAEAFATSYRLI